MMFLMFRLKHLLLVNLVICGREFRKMIWKSETPVLAEFTQYLEPVWTRRLLLAIFGFCSIVRKLLLCYSFSPGNTLIELIFGNRLSILSNRHILVVTVPVQWSSYLNLEYFTDCKIAAFQHSTWGNKNHPIAA